MQSRLCRARLGLLVPLVGLALAISGLAKGDSYSWTVLIPEHDSRAADVRDFDEFLSKSMLKNMNDTEKIFHHSLAWQKVPLIQLLSISTPFCELDFDAVKPLLLTPVEKATLKEYLSRSGFIMFNEDAYPYAQDEFWSVHNWPVIDFLTKELPASDHNFTFERITEKHVLFNIRHSTKIPDDEQHELRDNPYSPYLILVLYRGQPCAVVNGQFTSLAQNKWVALPRPFDRNLAQGREGYDLTVNLYVYVMTH